MKREVYFGHLEAFGEENLATITVASNYALALGKLERYAETKAVLRKMMPVAQRLLGENNYFTLKMRGLYATVLYVDDGSSTQDDLREAVSTLEDTERTARRVLGGAHPTVVELEAHLRAARAVLRFRLSEASSKTTN